MRAETSPGLLLYGALFVAHVALVWCAPFFPSQDGPTHIYNTLIIRDLLHGGRTYGAFYDLHLSLAPNLGAVVPLYALTAVLPPLAAEKMFVTVVLALLVGVMPRLARMVGGSPHPGALVVFPIVFSAFVLHGFYSFMLGMTLCLWALWFYWQGRHRALWRQWVVVTASAVVLVSCHLLPFACYLLAIGVAHLLAISSAQQLTARVRDAVVLLAVPAIILAACAWSLSAATPSVPYAPSPVRPTLWSGLNWDVNVLGLIYLFTLAQPALSINQLGTGFAMGAVLAWLFLRRQTGLSWRWPDSGSRTGVDAVAARRWLLTISAVLIVVMLVIPDAVGELGLIKIRFPALVCLLIVPLSCCVTPSPALRRVLVVVTLAVSAVNAWYFVRAAAQVETAVTGVPAGDVRGRFVAGYVGSADQAFAKVLSHTTSYYCALNDCIDLGNYQAFLGHFFVSFKDNPALAVSSRLDAAGTTIAWDRYPDVAYIRGWAFDARERERVGRAFRLLGEAGPASVWAR